MHNNFEVLEAKCKKYHLKKILKILLPIGFLFLVVTIGLFFFFTNEKKLIKVEQNELKKDTIKIEKGDVGIFKNTNEQKQLKSIASVKEQEKKIEEPDIFQDSLIKREDIEYDLHLYSYNLLNKKREKVIRKVPLQKKKVIKKQEISKIPKVKKVIIEQSKPKVKNNSFSIVLKNLDSTDKMIELYNKEKTYPIALKISKLFYKQKNYKKALLWSKKANNIDSRAEESWLIYAKSEYALGHIKRAKGILKVYVNNSNSKEAKALLISWIKGS